MRLIDLFSGIGSFSLGASRVWPDLEIVNFVEKDPFCQKVLTKNFPGVKIESNIEEYSARNRGTIDLLTGGFPCQPFSIAGKRKGKDDDRYLWEEMLRVIIESKAKWVVGENVANLWNMGIENVLLDLENEGYEVESFIIPACAVGAPHRRDRVWIVANHKNDTATSDSKSRQPRKQTEQEGREDSGGSDKITPNPDSQWQLQQKGSKQDERGWNSGNDWEKDWYEVATELCRVDDGVSPKLDRTNRLKGLGNAIVPQVAQVIFEAIKAIENE